MKLKKPLARYDMEDISQLIVQLLEESKSFLLKARNEESKPSRQAFLHASLLLAISSLEACLNSIAEELLCEPYASQYSLLEQSLLLERDIVFKNGRHMIGPNLKMSRILDRIEFLFYKFQNRRLDATDSWYPAIKQAINLRNNLVHPKSNFSLTINQVEQALLAVLELINCLYQAVYRRGFPAYKLGLNSSIEL